MDHQAFRNQDIVSKLTTAECMQLSNLKEMRRSLMAIIEYMNQEESAIFAEARARQGGPVNEAD